MTIQLPNSSDLSGLLCQPIDNHSNLGAKPIVVQSFAVTIGLDLPYISCISRSQILHFWRIVMKTNVFGIESVFSHAEDLLAAGIPLDVVDISTNEQPEPRTKKEDIRLLLEACRDSDLVMVLGGENGILALEIAPDNGGLESLSLLMNKVDLSARTPIVSPGNGLTYMLYRFQGTSRNGRVELRAGLDIVANGQYIVVPPRKGKVLSEGWWKNFPMDEDDVAVVPAQLAALL